MAHLLTQLGPGARRSGRRRRLDLHRAPLDRGGEAGPLGGDEQRAVHAAVVELRLRHREVGAEELVALAQLGEAAPL